MSFTTSLDPSKSCAPFVRTLSAIVILVSILVLAGWQFDIVALKSVLPGLTAMNPGGTAVAFFLTGISIWALNPPLRRYSRVVGYGCAFVVLLIALSRFIGYLWGWDGGPDQWLFRDKLNHELITLGHQNRMAPNTALAFALSALSLLFLDVRTGRIWPAQLLAVAVALISLLTVIGYGYNAMSLAGLQELIPMAINTGVCFGLVSAAVLNLRPDHGVMKIIVGTGVAGVMARRMLPIVAFVPALIGFILCFAQTRGHLSEFMVLSLFALSNIVIITALAVWTAVTLDENEKKIRDSELRYKLAVKGSNDGLWDWNVFEGKFYWSDRFKEMLDITDDAFKPSYEEFKKRLHPEDQDRITAELENHTKTHAPYNAEFRMRTDAGRVIWVRARGASVWDEAGITTRMSGAVTDITDWKRTEQELKDSREQADRESQIKSEFLANMSHELRTPLNSIIGLTRMLYEDKALDDEHRDMVGVAYRSADNLLDIVNDILDLSKVESGQMVLENITFSLQEVVDNIMETVLPLSSEKGLTLTCNFSTDNLPYFSGDPMRLGRVMMNLVSNAIKYTDRGSVTVDIKNKELDSHHSKVEFSVADTGIGIPKEKQHRIFGKFMQGDSSITRRFGGTGLGLHITKQLVEMMGGEIGFDSVEGVGSRFWFRIPFVISETRPIIDKGAFRREKVIRLPPENRKRSGDVMVLLAEDHLLNQAFMRRLLPRLGLEHFVVVENGRAVVGAIAERDYDLILMDCHMPVMSGYDATKEIRKRENENGGHMPIVAMTADAMTGTRDRCLKAGMDDYISKPINADELRYILGRWITFPDEGGEDEATGHRGRIDLSNLKSYASSREDMCELMELFLTESAATIATLRDVDADSEKWTEAAHKMKGGAAMFKAEKLRELCARAQTMKMASRDDRLNILKEIDPEYRLVVEAINHALAGDLG